MTRRTVREAYQNIRPDCEARARMLANILSASSENLPAGKDDSMKRWIKKPLVIAAIIGLMILMMGSAIVVLNLEDLKIGEYTQEAYSDLNKDGEEVTVPEQRRNVISLQGIKGTPNQLAAQEWYEFEQSYEVEWNAEREEFEQGRSEMYDAYGAYTQEMADKLDEIAAKYGLKLAGSEAVAQMYQSDIFFEALGLEKLHREGAQVEYLGGYFYECGNFNMEFFVTLTEAHWPYAVLADMRYNGKEYLDTVRAQVPDIDEVEQWHYVTAGGSDILIVMGENFARFFCDREDAFISVAFGTDYEHESGEIKYMSKEDVELVADAMDFTVKPQTPDMEAAKQRLAESEQEMLAKQEQKRENAGEYGYKEFIAERIEALENPEELYYTLTDIDQNGVVDLLLGHKDQVEVAWTIAYDEMAGYGHMNFVPLTDEQWSELEAAWPNMEIYPITTYPME